MKNKTLLFTGVIFLLTLLIILIYFLAFRNMVILACKGKSEAWFTNLLLEFYPRFFVERHRFPIEFFLAKADQVIIRFSFVSLVTCVVLILIHYSQRFKNYIRGYFYQTTSLFNANTIRVLYFICIIILFYDIYWILKDLSLMKAFYKPLPLLKVLHIDFPSLWTITLVCIAIYLSCILGIMNFFPAVNSVITLLLFIYIQGLLFSFEKMDHGFAPITYAGMIMPFLLLKIRKGSQNKLKDVNGWPLQLIQLLICLCYCFAGLEKLFTAGLEWIEPETFRTYLILHHTKFGLWVASSEILCTILPTGALLFQLGFISIIFNKKLIPYFLTIGIIFHISTYILFDVGGILHPWVLTYFFFIDWKKIFKR